MSVASKPSHDGQTRHRSYSAWDGPTPSVQRWPQYLALSSFAADKLTRIVFLAGSLAFLVPIAAQAEYSLTTADWRSSIEVGFDAEFESVAIGDVDGDGRQDLVAITREHWVHIFRQQADGTLATAELRSMIGLPCEPEEKLCPGNHEHWPAEVALADLTGDGKADIVVPYPGGLGVLSLTAPGRAAETHHLYRSSSFNVPRRIASIDANADGRLDLVAVDGGTRELIVFYGDGRGSFIDHARTIVGDWSAGELEVADLDADGREDIVYVERDHGTLTQSRIHLFFGVAGGGFPASQALDANDVELGPAVLGDVDGDGRVDIVHGPYLYRQVAARTFASATVAAALEAYSMRAGDLNGDGVGDIASLPYNATAVRYQLGASDGFADPLSAPLAFGAANFNGVSLALGDLNNDGCGDVAAAAGRTGITWLLGSGCAAQPDLATQIGAAGSAVVVRVDNLGPADASASSVDVNLRGSQFTITSIPAECVSIVGPDTRYRCNLGTVAPTTQRLLTFVLGTVGLTSRSSLTIEARATTPTREVRTTNNFARKLHRPWIPRSPLR